MYQKKLLSELRIVVFKNDNFALTDENLTKAITLNSELINLGYTLKPKDIISIACSSSLDSFYKHFVSLIDNVKAKPMYPNFPTQVMEMDEATYRFHQLIHYFSTYGVEEYVSNTEVKQGWLPNVKDDEKIEDDESLLKANVIDLIDESEMYKKPLSIILSKRERMTLPETEIVKVACDKVDFSFYKDFDIPFKENMLELSLIISESCSPADTVELLFNICQHAGDALRVIDYFIGKHRYKLKKSEQKMFTHLLDLYEEDNFKSNLILSLKKAKRTHVVLNHIKYTYYSKNKKNIDAVNEFRNGNLKSWESQFKYLLNNDKNKALPFISKRPGMLLRMIAWLIRLGFKPSEIVEELIKNANSLSTQTLVTTLTHFMMEAPEDKVQEYQDVAYVLSETLKAKLSMIDTKLKNKKVYVDEGIYSFENSIIEANSKSDEGGYIRSGIAYKIPENIKRLRFFVYWNDKHRIDIDLHSLGFNKDGTNFHIGWNAHYNNNGIVSSGDITHSNAAEYIDVDLENTKAQLINMSIHSYTQVPFKNIDTVLVGMLAVKNIGEKVKLYNPKNCFFSHNLKSNVISMVYGYINVEKRILVYTGKETHLKDIYVSKFTLDKYLELLFKGQYVELVDNKEDADFILTLDKSKEENNISIIDENFFMDC